jgi:hypothetical protein
MHSLAVVREVRAQVLLRDIVLALVLAEAQHLHTLIGGADRTKESSD